MSINWCTKYEDFEKENKEIIDNLKEYCDKEDKEELLKFLLSLIKCTFRSCEEYDSRFFDEDGEFCEGYSECDLEEEKLASFILWSSFVERESLYWFGPYDDYRKIDEDTFVVYESYYYADGSFSRTEDQYTFSFKDHTTKDIYYFINELMEFYRRVDACLDYENEIEKE